MAVDRAKEYGGTLTSDGWSNMQRRPITNFMLVTRECAVFMKSIDSTDHMADGGRKNAAYPAEQIIIVIKEVGAENIVQVIMGRSKQTLTDFFTMCDKNHGEGTMNVAAR